MGGITHRMKSYSENVFAQQFRGSVTAVHCWSVLLRDAAGMFDALPSTREPGLRCHEVARAVAAVLTTSMNLYGTNVEPIVRLEVVDGYYGAGAEHSWIEVYVDGARRCLLDPYCIGRMPPVALVDVSSLTMGAHRELYTPGKPRTDVDELLVVRLTMFLEAKFARAI